MKVLFLCTGNSCRSILAEAIFNHLAPAGWSALSAGSHPTGEVHPRSLALLAHEGISTAGCRSKSWEDLPVVPDIVVTVCASAAGETCPVYGNRRGRCPSRPALRCRPDVEHRAYRRKRPAETRIRAQPDYAWSLTPWTRSTGFFSSVPAIPPAASMHSSRSQAGSACS